MPSLAQWMKVAHASKKSGIPRRTLVKHIHDGILPATKLDGYTGAWLIERRDFDRYLRQHREKKTA